MIEKKTLTLLVFKILIYKQIKLSFGTIGIFFYISQRRDKNLSDWQKTQENYFFDIATLY